jgi:hypothetical protein
MTARLLASLCALVLLTGCARSVWVKPGASQQDFANDRYTCLQQSQQQRSAAQVNAYGGAASSGSYTNADLFNACMNAAGWYLQRQSSS